MSLIDEIDMMEAGDAMDRLVALHVTNIAQLGEDGEGMYWNDATKNRHVWPPKYSTDMAAAWEVIEEVRLRAHLIPTIQYLSRKSVWQVEFWCFGLGAWAQEKTAPHAICAAALKAVKSLKEARK